MLIRIKGVIVVLAFVVSLCFINVAKGQARDAHELGLNDVHKIEELILGDKLVEASALFTVPDSLLTSYQKILFDIANEKEVSYGEYYRFLVIASEMPGADHQQFSDFIEKKIGAPTNFTELDDGYVKIKWLQMMVLADEADTLKKAQEIKESLQAYINECKGEKENIDKANALAGTLQMVLYLIQGDIEKGKVLCLETVEIGKKLKDDLIQIVGLYHLCDFLVEERKLDEFIAQSEAVYAIESTLKHPSPYKTKNMVHLIDAYIFKGGHEARVSELLQQMYGDPNTRPHSYSLYAQFLTKLPEGNTLQKEIFKKFNTDSYVGFSHKIDSLSQQALISNEYYHVLSLTARMLLSKKEYDEAFVFKDKAIALNKKTYAEDLSQTLADFQIQKAVQEKEQELLLTKQKSKYYIIIAGLVAALLLISLGLLFNNAKKNKSLRHKNEIIKSSLEEKEKLLFEKQLLFKEMHHRVKNNFQLLSSLLELQNTNIKDENALRMAEEGQNRIKSMALIHQRLYEDDSLTISINEFVQKLVDEISVLSLKKPTRKIDIPDYKFDVDTAIPLGLILNELLTNAFKYGFAKENPILEVSLLQNVENDNYKLSVWDNGKGLPSKTSFEKTSSMGLWLVKRLSRQLGGNASYAFENGSRFTINFKDTQSRLRVD